jgi:hypothetical protein
MAIFVNADQFGVHAGAECAFFTLPNGGSGR